MLITAVLILLLYAVLTWPRRGRPLTPAWPWATMLGILLLTGTWRSAHWFTQMQAAGVPTPLFGIIGALGFALTGAALLLAWRDPARRGAWLRATPAGLLPGLFSLPFLAGVWADQVNRDGFSGPDLLLLGAGVVTSALLALWPAPAAARPPTTTART